MCVSCQTGRKPSRPQTKPALSAEPANKNQLLTILKYLKAQSASSLKVVKSSLAALGSTPGLSRAAPGVKAVILSPKKFSCFYWK